MEPTSEKTTATLTHLGILTQYFIPFGNFLFPIIIWGTVKDRSKFVDSHGRCAINFQLSILIYSIVLAMIAIPILMFSVFKNVPLEAIINDDDFIIDNLTIADFGTTVTIAIFAVFLFVAIKTIEFFLVIYASVKASNGELFKYPATINFIPDAENDNQNEPEIQTEPSNITQS